MFGYSAQVSDAGSGLLRIEMEKRKTELEMVQVSGSCDRGSAHASVLADRRADIAQNSLSARSIEISPDIQWILYASDKNKPVLVKVLLNEREVELPVPTTQWPYYRWEDVRYYYEKKLKRIGS